MDKSLTSGVMQRSEVAQLDAEAAATIDAAARHAALEQAGRLHVRINAQR